jgi:glycosyltransferase involved in cell wall biosynthesis
LITVPPFSAVLPVEELRKEFPSLKIVVDFRDEWLSTTFNLVSFSRSARAIEAARNVEAKAVTHASAVVAVTEAAQREIRDRYPRLPENKFHFIPNGFDETRVVRSELAQNRRPGCKVTVTYLGSIYGSTEPSMLVNAMQSLPAEVKSQFTLRFIGHIEEPRYREALMQLGEMVELKGYLPQGEALAAMNETDYVLLITHDPLNISAKFYDYIGSGKPILGCVHPEGDVRRLLDELQAGWWADSRDVGAIRQLFMDAAARCDSLESEFLPDTKKIAQYERKVLAHRYAELLHRIARPEQPDDSNAVATAPQGRAVKRC